MRTESQKKENNKAKLDVVKHPNQSRRSFAKAGMVAPVILSLPNRSAWGANVRCTPSGFGSLVEIGSGVEIADIRCNYSDSSIINVGNLTEKAKEKKLKDLFSCTGPDRGGVTVNDALTGSDSWHINMVIAFYNANPETTTTYINARGKNGKKGKSVIERDLTVDVTANNPFGAGCPVEDVYCHFEKEGADKPFQLGSNTEMTKIEVEYFLTIVLNQ